MCNRFTIYYYVCLLHFFFYSKLQYLLSKNNSQSLVKNNPQMNIYDWLLMIPDRRRGEGWAADSMQYWHLTSAEVRDEEQSSLQRITFIFICNYFALANMQTTVSTKFGQVQPTADRYLWHLDWQGSPLINYLWCCEEILWRTFYGHFNL